MTKYNDKFKYKSRVFARVSWVILVFGILSLVTGIYQIFFLKVQFGTNLRYLQPTVIGPLKFVVGLICVITAIFRFRNKNTFVRKLIEEEKEERRRRRKFWQKNKN